MSVWKQQKKGDLRIIPSTLCPWGRAFQTDKGVPLQGANCRTTEMFVFGGNQDDKIFVRIGLLYDGSFRVLYCNNRDKSSAIKV